jgi:hypothetical protein
MNLITTNFKNFLNENYSSKTIINVDIQPEYKDYITFDLYEWIEYINESYKDSTIIFLYNGYDSLGMIDESSYITWLFDLGLNEEVIENSIFYDKGYAFFRYCIDNSIDEESIVDLVKYMRNHNINDSRDIDEDMWNNFMEETNHNHNEIRELLETADDMLSIPDLMDFLEDYYNITLTGGGIEECLKEVELSLLALDKNHNINHKFTY